MQPRILLRTSTSIRSLSGASFHMCIYNLTDEKGVSSSSVMVAASGGQTLLWHVQASCCACTPLCCSTHVFRDMMCAWLQQRQSRQICLAVSTDRHACMYTTQKGYTRIPMHTEKSDTGQHTSAHTIMQVRNTVEPYVVVVVEGCPLCGIANRQSAIG